jgi:hypothetical protein
MNIALPALVVFLLILPGFVFRSRFKKVERLSLDYSPFGQVFTEGILWATTLHVIWLTLSYFLYGRYLDTAAFLKLVSSDTVGQSKSITAVAEDALWVAAYFTTLLGAAVILPTLARWSITKLKLDRSGAPLNSIFRFNQAPWYYLLTGADFERKKEPDLISISAIVEIAGEAYLYTGILDEFFVDADGQLDRLILQEVMRRPIKADKQSDKPDAWYDSSRFYPVDGDNFILRYSETITLNIQYIEFIKENAESDVSTMAELKAPQTRTD